MKLIKRYRLFFIGAVITLVLILVNRDLGMKAIGVVGFSFREMIIVIPPVFILLGLLDVWVPKEMMVRFMGEKAGLKGIVLAIFLGSAAAGPLYGAFPVAAVFMRKGVAFRNVLIFIGAWSTTKIPMFLFELSSLGVPFALTRLLVNIPGIIIIAYTLMAFTSPEVIEKIYENAEALQ